MKSTAINEISEQAKGYISTPSTGVNDLRYRAVEFPEMRIVDGWAKPTNGIICTVEKTWTDDQGRRCKKFLGRTTSIEEARIFAEELSHT